MDLIESAMHATVNSKELIFSFSFPFSSSLKTACAFSSGVWFLGFLGRWREKKKKKKTSEWTSVVIVYLINYETIVFSAYKKRT